MKHTPTSPRHEDLPQASPQGWPPGLHKTKGCSVQGITPPKSPVGATLRKERGVPQTPATWHLPWQACSCSLSLGVPTSVHAIFFPAKCPHPCAYPTPHFSKPGQSLFPSHGMPHGSSSHHSSLLGIYQDFVFLVCNSAPIHVCSLTLSVPYPHHPHLQITSLWKQGSFITQTLNILLKMASWKAFYSLPLVSCGLLPENIFPPSSFCSYIQKIIF